jgi:adenosine kinase
LSTQCVKQVRGTFTAQAFITTDLDDNQITAFHPGAMNFSHENHIVDAEDAKLGIVSPDGREGMLQHAREFADAGIPFIFDPGQGLPMFGGDDLLGMLRLADYCTVNDYEAKLLTERTGRTLEQLAQEVEALVVTLGANGSHIYTGGHRLDIPCVKPESVVDPTGCGDAYRAGLLYGISQGWDWVRTGQLASLMGSIKIAHRGGQNHKPTRAEIENAYSVAFGSPM